LSLFIFYVLKTSDRLILRNHCTLGVWELTNINSFVLLTDQIITNTKEVLTNQGIWVISHIQSNLYCLFILWLVHPMSYKGRGTIS